MNCTFSSSSPEAKFHVFPKSTHNQIPIRLSRVSVRITSSGPRRGRVSGRIRAFYTPSDTKETLYQLLEIPESGTLPDIKKAYKQMARKYHPDVSPPDRVAENTRKFIMVQEAYETLSNPQTRALYDRDLAMGSRFESPSRRPYSCDQRMEETGEWRMKWQAQLDKLNQNGTMRSCSPRGRMTWGARMRNSRRS